MSVNVREAALMSLERIEKSGRYSNLELDSAIKKLALQGNDRSLFTVLVYGVTEKRISLDYIISEFSKVRFSKLETTVINILRIGIYQIMYLERIPDSAACNESAELCRKYVRSGTVPFVNAVLRSVCREKNNIKFPDMSTRYSVPTWICGMWCGMYGAEKTESILKALSAVPSVTARVNTLKTSREKLISCISDSVPTDISPVGIKVDSVDSKMIDDGLYWIQDEASQLCTMSLDVKPGHTVIDCCAAPGGKSFAYAVQAENKGNVISLDLHENKLSLITDTARKLGIDIIHTKVQDGKVFNPEFEGIADRVACDVPCSGLGVIAKKPDLRYKSKSDIEHLPQLQYQILENNSRYVKDGGILVYSTCTLNKAENDDVIDRFLNNHTDFTICDGIKNTLFPDTDGTDGFFYAKLIRHNILTN